MRYFTPVDVPFERVEEALLNDPQSWIPGLASASSDRGQELLAQVGFVVRDLLRIDKRVAITLGEALRLESKTILPVTWRPEGSETMFPTLEGDLEVAPIGPLVTQLSMTARYEPPFGLLGRAADRALFHRIAEATIKDFIDSSALRLREANAAVAADAGAATGLGPRG